MQNGETDGGLKYRQVLDALRGEILSGRYQPGEKLPGENDLVKRFGISRITISRAVRELRDLGLVERRPSSGTYVRGVVAASAYTFGLLIPNLGQTEIFEPICRGMADAGSEHALLWGQAPSGKSPGKEAIRICRQYVERRVSGVFFAPLEFAEDGEAANRRIIAELEKARVPVVLLDRDYLPYPERSRHDLVGIDNGSAGYLATQHLLQLGCRRVAFLAPAQAAPTIGRRISGYRNALLDHGFPVDPGLIQTANPSDRQAVAKFLKTKRPDAAVCANDRVAADLMQTLLALGHKLPADLRLVGIDDVGYAGLLPVPLTTVHQPCREIGMAAVETMIGRLRLPKMPTRDVFLATRLVIRRSSGAHAQSLA